MNQVIEELLKRRSIKSFTNEPVADELIDKIAECGSWAPSGANKQSSIILIIKDRAIRDELSKLNAAVMGKDSDPFYGAPYVLVVLGNKEFPNRVYDGSLVMENMLLAADSLGLGACWIHRAKEVFETPEGKAILKKAGIEGEWEGIGNLILGHPQGDRPAAKPRKENWTYTL